MTSKSFTDKELQVCAQLGYLSFTQNMSGKTLEMNN